MTTAQVTIDGIDITYRDSGGDGPVVLLSSGIGQSLEFWDRQFDALAGTCRLIAWDYPNHGRSGLSDKVETAASYAAYLIAFLDALDIPKATLVGNSLGGAVSIQAYKLAPDRVAGLVLAAAAFLGPEVFFPFRLMSLPILGAVLTKPSEKNVEMQIEGVFHPAFPVPDDLRTAIHRNTFKPGADKAFLATMRATLRLSGARAAIWQEQRAILETVRCPVLFIHGRDDKILPAAQSEACARLPANSNVEIFDACGHAPQVEKPEAFNGLLSAYLTAV